MSEKKITPGGFESKNTFLCQVWDGEAMCLLYSYLVDVQALLTEECISSFQVFYSIVERVSMASRRKHEA